MGQKAIVVAEYLTEVFKPFDSELTTEEEKVYLLKSLDIPEQLLSPMRSFKISEVRVTKNQ